MKNSHFFPKNREEGQAEGFVGLSEHPGVAHFFFSLVICLPFKSLAPITFSCIEYSASGGTCLAPRLSGLSEARAMRHIASWRPLFLGNMRLASSLLALVLLCRSGVVATTLLDLIGSEIATICSSQNERQASLEKCNYDTTKWIQVDNMGISGSLPTELGLFSVLEYIWIRNNNLEGSIPAEIGNISTLKDFHLVEEDLITGTIPTEFLRLGALTSLSLVIVGVNGTAEILEHIPSLQNIHISLTDLSGHIPSFANTTDLRTLRFAYGDFTGPLPDILGQYRPSMTSIQLQYLPYVDSGPLYTQWHNAPRLNHLMLEQTGRTGTIPTEIGKLTSLLTFQIRRELLRGSVPQEVTHIPSLRTFRLQTVNITHIPSFGSTGNLLIMEIDNCPLVSTSLSSLNLHAHTKLRILRISNSQLQGVIPQTYLSLSMLEYLGLWNNQLTGVLPANAVASPYLAYLILNDNQLTGSIPPLPRSLVQLNLQNNMFQGRVPYTLDVTAMTVFRVGAGSNLACCGMNCTLFTQPGVGCAIECSDGASLEQNPCPPSYASSLDCLSLYQLLLEENALDPARIQATFTETRTVRGRITERTGDLQALLMEFTTKGCHKLMLVDSARLGL